MGVRLVQFPNLYLDTFAGPYRMARARRLPSTWVRPSLPPPGWETLRDDERRAVAQLVRTLQAARAQGRSVFVTTTVQPRELHEVIMARFTKIDPQEFIAIVGSTFVKAERAPLLVIGALAWNRWSLGRLGCPHPSAAAAVNRVVQELRIRSIADLAKHVHEIGRYKGLGVTAFFVVLAILREHGYDVKEVYGEDVTYATLKQRARKAQKDQRRRKPRRAGPPSDAA